MKTQLVVPSAALAIVMLFATKVANAADTLCQQISSPPKVTSSISSDSIGGMLALADAGGFRIFSGGCFRVPSVFQRAGKLQFRTAPQSESGNSEKEPRFLGVTITRIVKDVHLEWGTPNSNLIKVSRNLGWYRRVDAEKIEMLELQDKNATTDLDGWNSIHGQDAPPLQDLDNKIGQTWHGQVGDGPDEASYGKLKVWIDSIPPLAEDYRYVVSNQLIGFSGTNAIVPFYGEMMKSTDIFVIRFFFSGSGTTDQVVLCKADCKVPVAVRNQ